MSALLAVWILLPRILLNKEIKNRLVGWVDSLRSHKRIGWNLYTFDSRVLRRLVTYPRFVGDTN